VLPAITVAAAALALGLVLRLALLRLEARHERLTVARAGYRSLVDLSVPLFAIIGIWAGLQMAPPVQPWARIGDAAVMVAVVLLASVLGARLAAAAVQAYAVHRAGQQVSSIFVNLTWVVVLAVGGLIALQTVGISITPLLTALGVAGLAIALALQDTLSNLFAGLHLLASRKVRPGDFVRLDSGEQGYIEDITWRNTSIRQLGNNTVIVPNSRLASAALTNFYRPAKELAVLVEVGVAYDSDLGFVERVTVETAAEVMKEVPGGLPEHRPFIRYHTFNQSSIDFTVILRAGEFTDQYLIKHEFIKRLHRRYHAEGIQIPFPIRTVVMAGSNGKSVAAEPDLQLSR
jgi:small-conductance mechanosensitive channel